MPPKQATIYGELRVPLLVLLIVIPALAFAGWRVYASNATASRFQHDIRVSQIARARVFRLQLDEETGVRGYAATGDRSLLDPYEKALAKMSNASERLRTILTTLAIDQLLDYADDERRKNDLWNATVARPLLKDPSRSAASLEVQR
ncbi:MAG: CHASE3 domain-containing protein, partial [Candidatus Eremiobacteraeota bacterium]|nr:CHASE3 domain-containing protein [Candidatus Eremiobacteraeota bacterium]